MAKSKCGPQTELSSNDAVRITRCGCGTVHITMHASGITVRLSDEAFQGVAAGFGVAAERVRAQPAISATGSTSIN